MVAKVDRNGSMDSKLGLTPSDIRKVVKSDISVRNLVPAVKSCRVKMLDVNHPSEATVQVNNVMEHRARRGLNSVKDDLSATVTKTIIGGSSSTKSNTNSNLRSFIFGSQDLGNSSRTLIPDDTIENFEGIQDDSALSPAIQREIDGMWSNLF